ncbi:unnamed protein product [Polarella glacialis]|uniref:Uncharacterized protein n=1 Tax=Polarella glacialis TaxID=89957 RepID=A0A813JT28_POLGL|nr:unnamed protein product [Polarella glacialis]
MGDFLWRWRRDSYHFSIWGGLQRGLDMEVTCPSLRVALHTSNLKRACNRDASLSYEREAQGIMAAGLCLAAAAQGGLSGRVARSCRRLAWQAEELLAKADDVSTLRWTVAESGHCGARSFLRLLSEHWSLLSSQQAGTGPGAKLGGRSRGFITRFLQAALNANATGRYSINDSAHLQPVRRAVTADDGDRA